MTFSAQVSRNTPTTARANHADEAAGRLGAVAEDDELADDEQRGRTQEHHAQHEGRVGGDHHRAGARLHLVAVGDQRQRSDQDDDQRPVPVLGPRRQHRDGDRRGKDEQGAKGREAGSAHRARNRRQGAELDVTNVHPRLKSSTKPAEVDTQFGLLKRNTRPRTYV
jgi:hypothetical protein